MKSSKARATTTSDDSEREQLSLEQAGSHLLEECRTIVPGVQAVFGFQLVAVFSQGFVQRLSPGEQQLHLGAIALVVVAMGLVMAPAALHRQLEPLAISRQFLRVASRLLMGSMVPLALGVTADIYLVARVILNTRGMAAALAIVMLAVLASLWFVRPRSLAIRRFVGGKGVDAPP
jgi:hypothetical protein